MTARKKPGRYYKTHVRFSRQEWDLLTEIKRHHLQPTNTSTLRMLVLKEAKELAIKLRANPSAEDLDAVAAEHEAKKATEGTK